MNRGVHQLSKGSSLQTLTSTMYVQVGHYNHDVVFLQQVAIVVWTVGGLDRLLPIILLYSKLILLL